MANFRTTKKYQIVAWYFKDGTHFSRCHFSAFGMDSLQEITATIQKPTVGLCVFLYHNLGILYQIVRWCLRIGANFSPNQISPFQVSHVLNPPPPRYLRNVGASPHEGALRRVAMRAWAAGSQTDEPGTRGNGR